ncbi:MAG TPA: fibronectin type III domain-containing protein [Chitinispirillaceae bacterium]|nr:fibronectin type III domain-containing protein [Chitinispirillaceae bacterium]
MNKNTINILLPAALLLLLLSVFCADYDLLDQDPPVPPDPVKVKISKFSDSSVTLNWSKCTNDSFLCYTVQYAIGSYVGSDDPVFDTLSYAIDTFATIKSLADLTEYAFRVTVTLKNGASTPSDVVVTTTLENLKGKLKLTWRSDSTKTELIWTKSVIPCMRYRIFSDTVSTVDSLDSLIRIVTDTIYRISDPPTVKSRYYKVYARNEQSFVASSNIVEILLSPATNPASEN